MGGNGSGSYYRHSSQTTCEQVKRIDIRNPQKRDLLRKNTSGSLTWNIGGEPCGDICVWKRTLGKSRWATA